MLEANGPSGEVGRFLPSEEARHEFVVTGCTVAELGASHFPGVAAPSRSDSTDAVVPRFRDDPYEAVRPMRS